MGNTSSRDKDNNFDRKKFISSKTRRQSNRSTLSTKFSSASLSSFASSSKNVTSDSEQQQQQQQQQQSKVPQQHNLLLDRIKHGKKHHKKNFSLGVNNISTNFDRFNTSFDDLHQRSTSPTLSLPHSVNENLLIEKYTDSQMTLLHNNLSQVDNINHSNSTLNTTTTNNTIYTTNTTEEMKKAYSSELMLKELYMLSETSPERRRDRDRYGKKCCNPIVIRLNIATLLFFFS